MRTEIITGHVDVAERSYSQYTATTVVQLMGMAEIQNSIPNG